MKKLSVLILFATIFIYPHYSNAQSLGAFNKKYVLAKKYLSNKEYISSMNSFQELTKPAKNNVFIEYAYYFYALSAFHNKNLPEAKQSLENQLRQFPDWKGREDSYYLMGTVLFQMDKPEEAVAYLNKIQTQGLKEKADTLKMFFGNKMSLEELKSLQRKFADDQSIAQVTVDKIAFEATDWNDIILMESMLNVFDLQVPEPSNRRLRLKLNIKETYNVCVFLPFDLGAVRGGTRNEQSRKSIDFYQGMRLAQKHLSKEGVKINIFAYDLLPADMSTIQKAIASNELKKMDLLIAPLPENQYSVLANYASQEQVSLIHPFTDDQKYLVNDFTYLYKSTLETQAAQAATYAFKKYTQKGAVIFYDNLEKNVKMAQAHQKAVIEQGGKVLAFEQVTVANLDKIKSTLQKLDKSQVGYIFASSTSQKVATEIMNVSDLISFGKPLVTLYAWLKFNDLDFEEYEKQELNFIYPEYLDVDSSVIERINQDYKTLSPNKITATENSYIGYDIVSYFSKILKEYGTQNNLRPYFTKSIPKKGIIVNGFDFRKGNDNQFVPILELKNGSMKLVEKIK